MATCRLAQNAIGPFGEIEGVVQVAYDEIAPDGTGHSPSVDQPSQGPDALAGAHIHIVIQIRKAASTRWDQVKKVLRKC